jgi:hypothetical protein
MIPSLPHHRLPRLFLGLYTVISRLVGRNVGPAESVPRSLFVAFYPPGFRFTDLYRRRCPCECFSAFFPTVTPHEHAAFRFLNMR